MSKEEVQQLLNAALAKLAELQAAYDAAYKAVLSELERDMHRGEGSGAQERRREQHQQALRDAEWEAEKALAAQKTVVQQLQQQLNSL
ncbi:hypothetical protein KGP26_29920 (plasmid) [Serratia sp. JSRIV002]|uniref:hypothetical protein n=1 Tax=Serratia sp. JSRIV002 TaxID=2831894 RepID=UPI001CBC373E|nr:hypothetical protein [Serratia sp. JSRIV002]UAN54766.1 hypothetical protein KGP26_29920 [Serratia sp. JSRIV002]